MSHRILGALVFAACALVPGHAVAADATVSPATLAEQIAQRQVPYLLDVRTREEYAEGHIAGAVNIPVQELEARMSEVPAATPVVVYCHSGRRAGKAADLLRARGQAVTELDGSILGWRAAGLPEVRSEGSASAAPAP